MPVRRFLLAVATVLVFSVSLPAAASPDNARALQGLERGKVVWNITLEDPGALAGQMRVIRQTYRDLKGADIEPKMVLGFHSPNVQYLAKDLDHIELENMHVVRRFRKQLAKVAELDGVRIEACAIANRFFGMQDKAVRDDVEVVANGYVSFIAYQHRGYGMIGIH